MRLATCLSSVRGQGIGCQLVPRESFSAQMQIKTANELLFDWRRREETVACCSSSSSSVRTAGTSADVRYGQMQGVESAVDCTPAVDFEHSGGITFQAGELAECRNSTLPASDCVRAPLLDALASQGRREDAAFHFPGHKRGAGAPQNLLDSLGDKVFVHDLPELPELDNLFAPEGVILDAQEQAARVFGGDKTFFLVNGSTVGIQAAVMATCPPGKVLILPRNAHQCAVSAMVLSGSRPIFMLPEYNSQWDIPLGVTPESVRAALQQTLTPGENSQGLGIMTSENVKGVESGHSAAAENATAGKGSIAPEPSSQAIMGEVTTADTTKGQQLEADKRRAIESLPGADISANGEVPGGTSTGANPVGAVLIVSPTYHGVCSNIRAIAKICHEFDVPLIVDEAHGAHFSFHHDLPPGALQQGADVAIQSTHKVLGSLTQSAMCHVQGTRVDHSRIASCLQLLQSSSPSYLLIGSLDAATWQMGMPGGTSSLARAISLAWDARRRLSSIPGVKVLGEEDLGPATWAGEKVTGGSLGVASWDPLRITVSAPFFYLSGYEMDDILRLEFGVVAELPSLTSLTFAVSAGTTERHVHRLVEAYRAMSAKHYREPELRIRTSQIDTPSESEQDNSRPDTAAAKTNSPEPLTKSDTKPLTKPASEPRGLHTSEPTARPYSTPSTDPTSDPASGPPPPAAELASSASVELPAGAWVVPAPQAVMSPREAFFAESERVASCDAIGRLSAELLCPYPPGIPVLAPGEVVSEEVVAHLWAVLGEGGSVTGAGDLSLETILVIKRP